MPPKLWHEPQHGVRWWRFGGKDNMKAAAVQQKHTCLVERTEPGVDKNTGQPCEWHSYASYPTFQSLLDATEHLSPHQRHLFEIIPHGSPCKPYLDLDSDTGIPAPCQTPEDVVQRTEIFVQRIFKSDFGIDLPSSAFFWSLSANQTKFSMHLVVSTHQPQLVYHSNHKFDPQGASHLATRLQQLDPTCIGQLVDSSVYSKDRVMRLVGCSKALKPQSVLQSYRPVVKDSYLHPDEAITWLDDGFKVLDVPAAVPAYVRRHQLLLPSSREQEPTPEHDQSLMATRVLELLQQDLHPTAFYQGTGTDSKGRTFYRFNYSDRTEPCYTGNVHDGNQNLRCFVTEDGEAFAMCFSDRCSGCRPFKLGQAYREPDLYTGGAIYFDAPFLSSLDTGVISECPELDGAIREWMAGGTTCLSFRSPMGTGKTTLLDKLLQWPDLKHDTVLVVTYRQTLALEQENKLEAMGFRNYMKLEPAAMYQGASPKIICQIESLQHLQNWDGMPAYDVIVVDEIELVLHHFNSPTVRSPVGTMGLFVELLRKAGRVITMDAFWGNGSHEFLEKIEVSNQLVINKRQGNQRTFQVTGHRKLWIRKLVQALKKKENVVVVSLSTAQIAKIEEAVLSLKLLRPEEILVHNSQQDDSVKWDLVHVNEMWTKYRLVFYSPTISAGVDFSVPHFHKMFVYLCVRSCVPLGALQMTGRVRKLADNRIYCLAAHGVEPFTSSRPVLPEESLQYLRWMNSTIAKPILRMMALVEGRAVELLTTEEGTERIQLRPRTPLLMVQARYLSAREGADSRFYQDFKALAESGGHKVEWTDEPYNARRLPKSVEKPPPLNVRLERLLAAKDLTTEEHRAVYQRICSVSASRKDKEEHERYIYRRSFRLAKLDREFVKRHGAELENAVAPVYQLAELLYPEQTFDEDCQVSDASRLARSPYIKAVVEGLGFQSAFDTETVVVDIYKVYQEKLRGLDEFKDIKKMMQLFTQKTTRTEEITAANVKQTFDQILSYAGLKLKPGSRTREREDDKSVLKPTVKLEHGDMAELLRLRLRKDPSRLELSNEHAREALWGADGTVGQREEDYPTLKHLIDLASARESFLVPMAADPWGSDKEMLKVERASKDKERF